MGGTPLSGVCPSRGFALGLEIIRTQRAGKSGRRRGRLVGRRESQGLDGIGRRNGCLRGIRRISGRGRGGGDGKGQSHGSSAKEEGGGIDSGVKTRKYRE